MTEDMCARGPSARTPNILLLARWFPPTIGGIERYLEELYGRLSDDVGVDIVSPRGQEGRSDRCYRVYPVAGGSRSLGSKLPLIGISVKAMRLANRSDVLVAGHLLTAVPAVLLGWILRKPSIVHVYGRELHNNRLMRLKAQFLRRATCVVSISGHTTARLEELGVARRRIVQIPPGVDLDVFTPPETNEAESSSLFTVLTVGRLVPQSRYKGHDIMCKALRGLVDEGYRIEWRVVGDGPDLEYVIEMTRDLGIQHCVQFLGAVSLETLVAEYQQANIFAMPNREGPHGETEGFGMVFTEAQACATPVLAGVAGGTASAVAHGLGGWRVNGDDTTAVINALRDLLEDPIQLSLAGHRGRQWVMERHAWPVRVEELRGVIVQLLQQGG